MPGILGAMELDSQAQQKYIKKKKEEEEKHDSFQAPSAFLLTACIMSLARP